jgi:hypothetical protein
LTIRRKHEKYGVMNANIAFAITLLAGAIGMTMEPREGKAAELTSGEKAAVATFASTGCIMSAIARIYDPAHTTEDMAAEVGRACDAQAVKLGRARTAAGLDRGSPPSDDEVHLAAQKMAVFLIGQVRGSGSPASGSGPIKGQ